MIKILPTYVSSRKIKDHSIIAYFSSGTHIDFEKDDTIINELEEPKGVFFIKKGFIKACSLTKNGQENLIIIHEAGELMPLPWALGGSYPRGVYYKAITEVSVIRSSRTKLRMAMGNNSWLTNEIFKQSVSVIGAYSKRVQTLEYRTARERVIAELLYLADKFGTHLQNEVYITAPITHQDIANAVNVSRETASRILETFYRDSTLIQKNHQFVILDLKKLKETLG